MRTEDIKIALDRHTAEEMLRYGELHEKLDKIMNNHLAHIQDSVIRLEERVKLLLWVLGVVGSLTIANLFIK